MWGSNAPRGKSVPPAGSTNTKRNLLQVTPAVLLQPAGGTRSTFTSRGPYPPYTFTSCGSHPPYCCFVPVTPVALSCPTAADTSSKLLPLAGCAANLNTAVYDFMTNSRYLRARTPYEYANSTRTEFNSNTCTFIRCIVRTMSFRIIDQEFLNHAHASRHSNDADIADSGMHSNGIPFTTP